MNRRALKRAGDIEEARIRRRAVWFTCEPVEHGFRAGRRDLEHRSAIARRAPKQGGAVERAVDFYEASARVFTVSRATFETVEHGFRAGLRDREDCAARATSMTRAAPVFRRAVDRTVDIEEARVRVSAVVPAFETVEHAVFNTRTHSLRKRWAQRHAVSAAASCKHGNGHA